MSIRPYYLLILILLLLFSFALVSCSFPQNVNTGGAPETNQTMAVYMTQVVQSTLSSQLTQIAAQSDNSYLPPTDEVPDQQTVIRITQIITNPPESGVTPTPNPSQTASTSTSTSTPTVTSAPVYNRPQVIYVPITVVVPATQVYTSTPIVWTATPGTQYTATTAPLCYKLSVVDDVTYPDYAYVSPSTVFYKTWRIKNVGTCTWTPDFVVAFHSGTQMSAPNFVNLTNSVYPNGTIDVTLPMSAPSTGGVYTGYWIMRTASSGGTTFGWGNGGNNAFWVKVTVSSETPTSSSSGSSMLPPVGLRDFAYTYCTATWTNSASSTVGCSSGENFTNGSVYYSSAARLEPDYQEDEAVLVTIPNNNGYIRGTYPAYTVQAGDHFHAKIGCLANSLSCNTVFSLYYSIGGGAPTVLWTTAEIYDASWTTIDYDLSGLAGQTAQFILEVNSNGVSTDDRAFWLVPKITNP